MQLQNYVCGEWVTGKAEGTVLCDPVTGTELARAGSDWIDLAAALRF